MASIYGISLKGIKYTEGREGQGCIAKITVDGKDAGTYRDYGDGGCSDIDYNSSYMEERVVKAMVAIGKNRPNKFLEKLYEERPTQYKEELERFKKNYPYIPESDITLLTICNDSIDCFFGTLIELIEREKTFKKCDKKGFPFVGVKGVNVCGKRTPFTEEEKKNYEELYSSLDDFIISENKALQIALPSY